MRRLLVVPVAVLLVLVAAAVLARGDIPCDVLATQPVCEVAMRPGPVEDTATLVEIPEVVGETAEGQLLLTTVAVDDGLGPVEWLRARASSAVDVVAREQVFPPGLEPDAVAEQNAALMADSQLNATVAALAHLGVELTGEGARIAAVTEDAVTDRLEVDDVLVSADGEPITDSAGAAASVQASQPGQTIVFELLRDRRLQQVEVELGESPDQPGQAYVGVLLVTELDLPVEVEIDAGRIGGPSAGLMFALTIVGLLDERDVTGGRVVAGTGTIDFEGRVGGVGGVRQKLVAATARPATEPPVEVFLVPRSNLDQARRAPVEHEVLVVPVDDLDGAVAALDIIAARGTPPDAFTLLAGGGVVDAAGERAG